MFAWRPTASFEHLQARAALLATIRQFFAKHRILEVETPLLAQTTILDPNIESLQVVDGQQTYFLQTSPEFFMKRLLAAGSGSIFQVSKAFRQGEHSYRHNPEFTLLEWYRTDWDYKQLMTEVAELIQLVLATKPAKRLSYRALYLDTLGIDPWHTTPAECRACISEPADVDTERWTVDVWLDYLFATAIEPKLGWQTPVFIYDYPERLAALAECTTIDGNRVAKRFELYINGVELANGFQELTDAEEQRKRFFAEQASREAQAQSILPIDEKFLQALNNLPRCAGVALGVDRLLMLKSSAQQIDEVLAFPINSV